MKTHGRWRSEICEYLGYLGVEVDEEKNKAAIGEQAVISTPDSKSKNYCPSNKRRVGNCP